MVSQEVSEAVRRALEAAPSLDAWARSRGERGFSTGGRGSVHLARLGERRVVVRHARRGGWMRILGDRYFDRRPRAFVELVVSDRLRASGVATPEVLAALVVPSRLGHRSDIATERLEPGHDLLALLAPNAYDVGSRRAALAAAGRQVGLAHAAGLNHPDLNVGNLFLQPLTGGGWAASILDLDRASLDRASSGAARHNVERFVRSLEKERRRGRIIWDRADLHAFLEAHTSALREDRGRA